MSLTRCWGRGMVAIAEGPSSPPYRFSESDPRQLARCVRDVIRKSSLSAPILRAPTLSATILHTTILRVTILRVTILGITIEPEGSPCGRQVETCPLPRPAPSRPGYPRLPRSTLPPTSLGSASERTSWRMHTATQQKPLQHPARPGRNYAPSLPK